MELSRVYWGNVDEVQVEVLWRLGFLCSDLEKNERLYHSSAGAKELLGAGPASSAASVALQPQRGLEHLSRHIDVI